MGKILGVTAAGLQVLVLTFMAGERELLIRTGRTVYLRTAPIDPRDVMRGDYVRLDYELSRVPRFLCRDGLARRASGNGAQQRDHRVYALLSENEHGVAELLALSDMRPVGGLFIRGRADWVPWTDNAVPVRYGLEAYFMEQGLALELEQLQIRDNIQVPLEMAVAVRGDGLAVLKNHRWSALGIGLELQTGSSPNNSAGGLSQPVLTATVRVLNASQNDQAIVDLPNAGSLAVVPDLRGGAYRWRWVGEEQKMPAPRPDHVIVLKPGEVHTFHVDFRDPAWSVEDTSPARRDLPAGIASLSDNKLIRRTLVEASQDWSARFRLEYRPPGRDACAGLSHAELIWHGRLPTRAFSGGRVD